MGTPSQGHPSDVALVVATGCAVRCVTEVEGEKHVLDALDPVLKKDAQERRVKIGTGNYKDMGRGRTAD